MRGLERTLHALAALEASPIVSPHELHRATGISKPSLLRTLHTLARILRPPRTATRYRA